MKVVLFCGGLGLRMRPTEDSAPKPMMPIGHRPVLWHVMRYYAHFGHRRIYPLSRLRRESSQGLLPRLPGDRVE